MLLAAYVVDVTRQWREPDYGFWLSFFGLLAFWGGLSLLQSGGERHTLLYGLLKVALIFVGVVLDRRAFVVFGALGVNGYLGHLAWEVFAQSALFPFVLTQFGLFANSVAVTAPNEASQKLHVNLFQDRTLVHAHASAHC